MHWAYDKIKLTVDLWVVSAHVSSVISYHSSSLTHYAVAPLASLHSVVLPHFVLCLEGILACTPPSQHL